MGQKGNALIIIILTAVILLSLSAMAMFAVQNKSIEKQYTPSPTPMSYDSKSEKNIYNSPTSTPSPTAQAAKSTIVVIESKANISATDLDQLQARVINPYLDYYNETMGEGYIATFTIAINTQQSKTSYPYTAKAIFTNAAYNDFLIAKSNGSIQWWLPECLNGCKLSETFKTKYPEISTKVQ